MSDVFECTTAVVSEARGGMFTRDHHPSVPTTRDDVAAHLAAFRVCALGGGREGGGGGKEVGGKEGEREGGRGRRWGGRREGGKE